MWYLVKGEKVSDNGAAWGSRAVLTLGVCFLIACLVQSVTVIVDDIQHVGPLNSTVSGPQDR